MSGRGSLGSWQDRAGIPAYSAREKRSQKALVPHPSAVLIAGRPRGELVVSASPVATWSRWPTWRAAGTTTAARGEAY